MKTVISSTGNVVTDNFEMRFGRAEWFCVYDESTKETSFVRNPHAEAQGGAGTKTAELMAELNATKVISGHFGPKAKDMLNMLNIQMVALHEEDATITDIIQKIK